MSVSKKELLKIHKPTKNDHAITLSSNLKSSKIPIQQSDYFYLVITLCDNAKENCPFFPGKKIIHNGFRDPANIDGSIEEILNSFKKIRDEIKDWIINEFGKNL